MFEETSCYFYIISMFKLTNSSKQNLFKFLRFFWSNVVKSRWKMSLIILSLNVPYISCILMYRYFKCGKNQINILMTSNTTKHNLKFGSCCVWGSHEAFSWAQETITITKAFFYQLNNAPLNAAGVKLPQSRLTLHLKPPCCCW